MYRVYVRPCEKLNFRDGHCEGCPDIRSCSIAKEVKDTDI